MRRLRTAGALAAVVTLAAAAAAAAGPGGDRERDRGHHRHATATLVNTAGETVGRARLSGVGRSDGVRVEAAVRGLTPGWHGFHVHAVGACTPPGFTSAGGHYDPTGAQHRDHAGDLPTLLVKADGTGVLVTETDRFSLRDLRDADGSAIVVHQLPDNHANIPARYGGPDQETRTTGDSGARAACGVVR